MLGKMEGRKVSEGERTTSGGPAPENRGTGTGSNAAQTGRMEEMTGQHEMMAQVSVYLHVCLSSIVD